LSICCLLVLSAFVIEKNKIDPTGTYTLDGKEEDGEIYGYHGQILVKKIAQQKILMSFDISKGAPGYNSGSFLDTLSYDGVVAVYKPGAGIDSTCQIQFLFTSNGVTVNEETADFNVGCGFGHAVVAHGFFRKTSDKEPIFER
jgi:hypothetical protein